jgi:histone deacetylase 6
MAGMSMQKYLCFWALLTGAKADVVKTYIDHAIEYGFAVIDANLPRHVTGVETDVEHEDNATIDKRTDEALSLLAYIWDNYIAIGEATHVFLMGTNVGHGAIVNFIKTDEERAQMITSSISFIEDAPLLSVKSQTNDQLERWYHKTSQVFMSSDHGYWTSEFSRKPKRRFGRLTQSGANTLPEMLTQHCQAVMDRLAEETADWRAEHSNDAEMSHGFDANRGQMAVDVPIVPAIVSTK